MSIVTMSTISEQVAADPSFMANVSALPNDERVALAFALAYQRDILILRAYNTILLTLLITC